MKSRQIARMVQDRGYNASDMAKLFGISERTWYYWTSKPELHFTLGRIRLLADALKLSEWEIVEIVKGGRKWMH